MIVCHIRIYIYQYIYIYIYINIIYIYIYICLLVKFDTQIVGVWHGMRCHFLLWSCAAAGGMTPTGGMTPQSRTPVGPGTLVDNYFFWLFSAETPKHCRTSLCSVYLPMISASSSMIFDDLRGRPTTLLEHRLPCRQAHRAPPICHRPGSCDGTIIRIGASMCKSCFLIEIVI